MEMMGLNLFQMTPPLSKEETLRPLYTYEYKIESRNPPSVRSPCHFHLGWVKIFSFKLIINDKKCKRRLCGPICLVILIHKGYINRLFWCARGYKIQPGPQGRPRHVVLTNSRLFLFPKVLFTSPRPEIHPIPFNPICPPATVLHPSLTCYLKRKLSLSSLFGRHARRAEFTSD